jgi:hypothetical protein
VDAHRVVRRRGTHIFYTIGTQMAVRLSALRAGQGAVASLNIIIPGVNKILHNLKIMFCDTNITIHIIQIVVFIINFIAIINFWLFLRTVLLFTV